MAFGDYLVAVHPHRGRVISDAERQIGRGPAKRIERQHRDLTAGRNGIGLIQPFGRAQGYIG